MAEYRRIVSYLYKYENGKKGENTGFVRVETRQDGIRLFFHIKDLRMMDVRNLKVYFYFHQNEKKKGIYVDEFLCSRGYCEYKKTISESILGDNGTLNQMDGMVFYDEHGLLYGTCWDEREITQGEIELPESSEPDTLEEVEEEPEKEDKEEKEAEEGKNQESENEILKETKQVEKEERTEKGSDRTLHMEELGLSEMEKMLRDYPSVPIQWNQDVIQTAEIHIDDISRFPVQYWKTAQNAFLRQAYEIYKYLMLGRIEMQNGKKLWVLGVPGIYHNREKYLAQIFGFYDYIPVEEGKIKTGGKGFWLMTME